MPGGPFTAHIEPQSIVGRVPGRGDVAFEIGQFGRQAPARGIRQWRGEQVEQLVLAGVHAIHGPPLTFQLGVIGVYVAMGHRGVVGGVSAHARHDTSHGVWIVLSGIPASVTLIIMTDDDADETRFHDLLSEESLVRLHSVVYREAWEMREIGRLDER